MTDEEKAEELRAKAHAYSAALWVLDNKFINENQQPFEFDSHRFMLQPYTDVSADQVIMKSAQVGWSVAAILKSIHAAYFTKLNVIYVLPTRNASAEFVVPKVNPMLQRNPKLKEMVKNTDNKSMKAIGDRFVYFRGAHHEGEAISTSADLIVADEFDRSDQAVLMMMRSRLQASDYRWYWKFSNPSIPGFGVHELYQDSDQMHWIVTCHHCGHKSFMEFEKNKESRHYVDRDREIYACGNCDKEISTEDRQDGQWVAKYPKRKRRGYWLSQMMIPWVSASLILEQEKEMDTASFHNMVLGLPYQASELLINRQAIIQCLAPGASSTENCFMGVDNGIIKHWVLGNESGIIAYGETEDWREIELIMRNYNATTVIDANPYPNIPKQLAEKYPNKVFIHYYSHDSKTIDISVRDEGKNIGVIKSDRTKLLDAVASDIATQSLLFYMTENKLEQFIYHCENMYRIVEEDARGIKKGKWETKENRPDHLLHALAYYKVARGEGLTSEDSGGVRSNPIPKSKQGVTVYQDKDSFRVKSSEIVDIEKSIEDNIRDRRRRI